MRIYIQSAPEDLAEAQRLADQLAQQPDVAGNPDSPITVAAPTDTATAERLIDENTMIVFLFSLNVFDGGEPYMEWLAYLVEYALIATGQDGAKFVIDARLQPIQFDRTS